VSGFQLMFCKLLSFFNEMHAFSLFWPPEGGGAKKTGEQVHFQGEVSHAGHGKSLGGREKARPSFFFLFAVGLLR
jgi:hypothetical protein